MNTHAHQHINNALLYSIVSTGLVSWAYSSSSICQAFKAEGLCVWRMSPRSGMYTLG